MANENTKIENSYTDLLDLNFQNCWLAQEDFDGVQQETPGVAMVGDHKVLLPCACADDLWCLLEETITPMLEKNEHLDLAIMGFHSERDYGYKSLANLMTTVCVLIQLNEPMEYTWNPHDAFRPISEQEDRLSVPKNLFLLGLEPRLHF